MRAAARERRRLPQDRVRAPDHLGRRRRLTAVGRPHRPLRVSADARHHRRAPERFAPYIELYRRAAEQFGTTAHPVGMHSPGFIADTDEEAREVFWPHYRVIRDRIGALRGWPPIRREEFERRDRARLPLHRLARDRRPQDRPRRHGRSASAGSTSIYTAGAQPVSARLRAVELYGTQGDPDGPRHARRLTAWTETTWTPRHAHDRHPGCRQGRHRARAAGPGRRLPRAHRRIGRPRQDRPDRRGPHTRRGRGHRRPRPPPGADVVDPGAAARQVPQHPRRRAARASSSSTR